MMNLFSAFNYSPLARFLVGALMLQLLMALALKQWAFLFLPLVVGYLVLQLLKEMNNKDEEILSQCQKVSAAEEALANLRGRLQAVDAVCADAARGNLNARLVGIKMGIETSSIENNINRVLDLVEAFCKEAYAASQSAAQRKYYRKIMLTGLRGDFRQFAETINQTIDLMAGRDADSLRFAENNVKVLVESVSQAASALNKHAGQLAGHADMASQQAVTAAAGVEQSSVSVQTVADTAENMARRSAEIAERATKSRETADEAKQKANDTNQTVSHLADAAKEIGAIIEIIEQIAGQTNLLALNATIEAARAGEAGKGFAVVADEVKKLSTRTRTATEDIRKQVEEIQKVANGSVRAIRDISETLINIGDSSAVIANGVAEQNVAIGQIAQNLGEAAAGTRQIASAVEETKMAATETSQGSQSIAEVARDLSTQASQLSQQVEQFIFQIKKVGVAA